MSQTPPPRILDHHKRLGGVGVVDACKGTITLSEEDASRRDRRGDLNEARRQLTSQVEDALTALEQKWLGKDRRYMEPEE
jgi:phosphate uptake regulator